LPAANENRAAYAWWKVAKNVLEYGMPDLINNPILAQLAQGKTTRRFKSRIKSKILERLENRFLKLFPQKNR
jgi:hypothetical protein